MNVLRPAALTLALLLALASGSVLAQASRAEADGGHEWFSYRDAYRTMIWFEKYGKPKNLLQHHYQVQAREKGAGIEGTQLQLLAKSLQLNLALDPTGRVVFPFLKAAYDENAELVLSRKLSGVTLKGRVSIAPRADGVYEAADLHAACEQALQYQQYAEPSALRGKKCVGVKFVYARKSVANAQFRKNGSELVNLPAGEGPAFWDDVGEPFRNVVYQFGAWPDKGQVLTPIAPLAISPLFD